MKDHDGILVLWNDNEFAELLKQRFGGEAVVSSQTALGAKDFQKEAPKAIIALAELDWEGKKLSDLYGITISGTILRAKLKLRSPILFVSFLPYQQIRADRHGKEILERRIAGVVGHQFVQLPSTPDQWLEKLREMQPLTDIQFADVFNSFCGVKGLIEDVVHQLGNRCRALFNSQPKDAGRQMQELVERAFDEITSLLGDLDASRSAKANVNGFGFETADMDAILNFLSASERHFKSLISDNDTDATTLAMGRAEPLPWKALILDDEPQALSPILNALTDRGVGCLIAQSVAEARQIIAADRNNEITVAISDYRLLETFEGITRQQRQQGYDFLLEVAKGTHTIKLVALSGLSRRFLLESFRRYNTRVEVYSKNDLVSDSAVNLFADNILDIGNEAYEAVCSQPSSAAEWKVLKPFYLAHRQAADYALEEQRIGQKAKGIAFQIDALLKQGDEELLLNPQLRKFGDLQKRMSLRDLSEEERAIKMTKLMPAFRNKLTARRLAIWLQIALGFDAERIFLALNGELMPDKILEEIRRDLRQKGQAKGEDWAESIEANAWAELKNRAKQPLTFLALTLSELPNGILAEEKAWLNYDMGLDLDDPLAMDQIYYWFQVAAEDWCIRNAKLGEGLTEGADGVPAIANWQDARRFLLGVRSRITGPKQADQLRDLLQTIQAGLASERNSRTLLAEFEELVRQLSLS